ncbi:MAG TPA: heparinase II/III family protein [Fimbriimonadales bacterium]|jgi:hypothetical protein|nr:heparinase II/III family protein [Fimbriimonadales bacterium]
MYTYAIKAAAVVAAAVCVAGAGAADLLAGLKAHPRLLFTESDESRIKALARKDPLLDALVDRNNAMAQRFMNAPTVKRVLVGPRLLDKSREAIERILTLSMAYRMTGDYHYALRARDELIAVSEFPDWNPSHFLDVAEMTTGVAIGYDWLYDFLGKSDRQTVSRAIIVKGLKPGLTEMAKNPHWITGANNWTSVCMGGLTVGALAIADVDAATSRAVLDKTMRYFKNVPALYKPDGASPEGPLYWHYAMTYQAVANNALRTALGPGHGVMADPVFKKTGWFPIYMRGPTGQAFNFADSWTTFYPSVAMFELAREEDEPFFAWWFRERVKEIVSNARLYWDDEYRFMPLAIAWYDSEGSSADAPLDRVFHGKQAVVSMRGSWTKDGATFIAAKGGTATAPHAHEDIGSFVMDALGVRWAVDLGFDDYNIPGYFEMDENGRRWDIFRVNSLSHNTIVIGGKAQRVAGPANIPQFGSTKDHSFALIDLGPAYRGQARRALRGILLYGRSDVLIQDEITQPGGDVRWGMATGANIDLQGDRAILSQSGKKLIARILAPASAVFTVESMNPPTARERRNPGMKMLSVRVKPGSLTRIAIVLSPQDGTSPALPSLRPLSDWSRVY